MSAQPKLSGEMTLNRIRTACQRDTSMPEELKKFNVQLLVNDLNTLGFDISLKDSRGRERDSDELCKDIKKAALPDVEELCMMNASKKGEAMHAVEQMVSMFNKYYGARIQLYKNPLDKSRGKRGISDLCDDLYMVMDKMKRRLTDHPTVVKTKLKRMIDELELQKRKIDGQFGAMMVNLRMAKDKDKMDEKLKLASTLQDIVSTELGRQTEFAKEKWGTMMQELGPYVRQRMPTGAPGVPSPLATLEDKLRAYRDIRFLDLRHDEKVKRLLEILKASAPAIQSCKRCVDKFGLSLEQYLSDDSKQQAKFSDAMAAKFKVLMREAKDNKELRDLVNCYQMLLDDREKCRRGAAMQLDIGEEMKKVRHYPAQSLHTVDSVAAMVVAHWKRGPVVPPPVLSYGSTPEQQSQAELGAQQMAASLGM